MFEKTWTLIAVLIGLSNRGDKWVAKRDGKVILVDRYGDAQIGMSVPITIYRETEKCDFGRIARSVIVGGEYAFLPADFNFSDDEAIESWVAEWRRRREEKNRQADARLVKYKKEQAERKEVAEGLLDLDSRRDAGRYMARINKRSEEPLTADQKALLVMYFGLPPWGISDHNTYITTDSYTD